MELTNDFRVDVPVPEAWKVLTDVERIAPFMPGAQLQEVEGDEYRGVVKVKVGPITAQYKGTATFVETDEAAGRVVLRASGRDTRGQGNASATITAVMVPDGDGTKVSVVTDLTITGKVAQFGRGVLADISAKLIGQFVESLEADLAGGGPGADAEERPATPGPEAAVSGSPAETSGGPDETSSGPAESAEAREGAQEGAADGATTTSGVRRIDAPEAEPVDLLDAAGGSVAKRLLPVVGIGLALAVVVLLRRRRAGQRARAATVVRLPPPLTERAEQLAELVAQQLVGVREHVPDAASLRVVRDRLGDAGAVHAGRLGRFAGRARQRG
jgi:carbon monoxide dehydrogenase subunit G